MKFLDKTGLDTLWAKIKSTFQTLGNLVTSWSGTPSDTKYPSEKLVKTSLDGKVDKNAIPDINDGAWVGVKPGALANQDASYWKVCSFNAGNYWSLDFRVSATNRNYDANVYEDKIISLEGGSASQVASAREIRLCYNKIYSNRGYGNIFYYTLIEGVVTIYVYTACKANVTQFLRLDSVTTKSSVTNLTWYSTTTPAAQPSNPVKFTESFQAMKLTTATTTKTYLAGVNATGYASGSQTSLLTDTGIYATTNPGELNATQFKINEHCTVTYNDARASVDFTFS